jgi:hypothetical protein
MVLPAREYNISARPCAMGPSDQDDILHPIYFQPKLAGPREPAVDMPDDPPAEIWTRYRVLRLRLYWKA